MLEFIIGAIAGAFSLWLATVNKLRFSIYDKKFDIYCNINTLSTILIRSSTKDKNFNENMEKLRHKAYSNSLIASDAVLDAVHSFVNCDFSPNRKSEPLKDTYYSLLQAMRDELQITFMSELNRIFTNPTKINLSKVMSGLLNNKNSSNPKQQ